ncbi:MAG: hypothetical protein HOV87_25775 [Catenulispora sp.]|nr:hypothetical protein [Catenulispora sp.]
MVMIAVVVAVVLAVAVAVVIAAQVSTGASACGSGHRRRDRLDAAPTVARQRGND